MSYITRPSTYWTLIYTLDSASKAFTSLSFLLQIYQEAPCSFTVLC